MFYTINYTTTTRLAMLLILLLPTLSLAHCCPGTCATAEVSYVVDGDTVEVTRGYRIRLAGIDTPERGQPWAAEATALVYAMVHGRRVRLSYDAGRFDHYGRVLAYLSYGRGQILNLELVRQGLARVRWAEQSRYLAELQAAETEAKAAMRGIWQK